MMDLTWPLCHKSAVKPRISHPWNVTYQEAVAIQELLRKKVNCKTSIKLKKKLVSPDLLIAGADISYNLRSPLLYAAVVVMRLGELEPLEVIGHRGRATFPYVPGLLSFREIPVLLEAMTKVKSRPDVLLCDGQGLAHPRRFGLASHLGVLLDVPTIGCAKSRLIGAFREPGLKKGSSTMLREGHDIIGRVVRTRNGVKPLYISTGHRIALDDAVKLALKCSRRYRIPEPVRQAHIAVNHIRMILSES